MSPLSKDPDKRANQLRNLPNLRGEATSASWLPGSSPALVHGGRTRRPAPVVTDPIVREIERALADDLPLRAQDGGVPAPDRVMVELAAVALLRVRRVSAFLELHGDTDTRGRMRPELDTLGAAVESAARMLDRLGCSPKARAALGVDVARSAALLRGVDLTGLSDDELEAYRAARANGGG